MKRVRDSNLNKTFRFGCFQRVLALQIRSEEKSAARKAVSLRDWYAPNRIFFHNTALKNHGRRQPSRDFLSCLAEKSLALECFAVLNRRFFVRRKLLGPKEYRMYFKDDKLPADEKIHSKPCKSLSEPA